MSWKSINYLRQDESLNYDHIIILPEPLANWDVWDYWERERVRSMESKLTQDDILFDVGAETGWMSIVFAKFCKIFLIEPNRAVWANIYQTWMKNRKESPIGFYSGLLGRKTSTTKFPDFTKFPEESFGELVDINRYEYIHQHAEDIVMMSLDDLVKESGITPTAINVDVEGAELDVLIGAKKTLLDNDLKVWVSIHPDLAARDYGIKPEDVHKFMKECGYSGTYLATDHEEHWFYEKK